MSDGVAMEEKIEALVDHVNLSSPEARDEQVLHGAYRQLRERKPVARLSWGQGPSEEWLVTRYRDVAAIYQDTENYSSTMNGGGGLPGPIPEDGPTSLDDVDPFLVAVHSQKIPLGIDPPDFDRFRPQLNPLFSPAKAKDTEWITREVAVSLVDDLVGRSEVEIHAALTKPMPAMVICRVLGLPVEEWNRWAITTPDVNLFGVPADESSRDLIMARCIPSLDAQMTMLRLADERRRAPADDVITAIAHLTTNGRLLNFYELGALLSTLLSGGVHTTTLAMDAALLHLGRHHDVYDELAARPDSMRHFVEEVLRMWPPLNAFARLVTRDVVVSGQPVSAGDVVRLCIGSANRDAEEFDDPQTFMIDRQPNRHLTFATGIHKCLGASLARQELRVALEEVLARLPKFTIDESRTNIPALQQGVHDPSRKLTVRFA